MAEPTVLKALLIRRHLQEHQAFCKEYKRVAKTLDNDLVNRYPSKATFYRWLAGEVNRLPFPGNCRVLESMFPGWSAEELFEPWDKDEPPKLRPSTNDKQEAAPLAHMADVTAVYSSRTEFAQQMPPGELFANASRIRMAGLSLNMLCQNYPDHKLHELLRNGLTLECLFLDPDGPAIASREAEEGLNPGHLSMLTKLNMQVIERAKDKAGPELCDNIQMRTYDQTIRFNITLVDQRLCAVQPYLPGIRGVDSPTFIAEKKPGMSGLYATFETMYNSLWEGAERQ